MYAFTTWYSGERYRTIMVLLFMYACINIDLCVSFHFSACYPNGTIIVNNPNTTVFDGVIATYNDGTNINLCSVSGSDPAIITNCNLVNTAFI